MVLSYLHSLCIKGLITISCTCVPPISNGVIIFIEISKEFSRIVSLSNFCISSSTLLLSPEALWLPAPRSSLDNRLLSETSFDGFQHLMVLSYLHSLCIKGLSTISCTCVPPISSGVIIFIEISKEFS